MDFLRPTAVKALDSEVNLGQEWNLSPARKSKLQKNEARKQYFAARYAQHLLVWKGFRWANSQPWHFPDLRLHLKTGNIPAMFPHPKGIKGQQLYQLCAKNGLLPHGMQTARPCTVKGESCHCTSNFPPQLHCDFKDSSLKSTRTQLVV